MGLVCFSLVWFGIAVLVYAADDSLLYWHSSGDANVAVVVMAGPLFRQLLMNTRHCQGRAAVVGHMAFLCVPAI